MAAKNASRKKVEVVWVFHLSSALLQPLPQDRFPAFSRFQPAVPSRFLLLRSSLVMVTGLGLEPRMGVPKTPVLPVTPPGNNAAFTCLTVTKMCVPVLPQVFKREHSLEH